MTDGQDLDEDSPSSLIQNSAIALLLFALTPHWAEEEQALLYDHVIRLVSKHDINQSILANTNLIYQLLDLLPQITAGPVQGTGTMPVDGKSHCSIFRARSVPGGTAFQTRYHRPRVKKAVHAVQTSRRSSCKSHFDTCHRVLIYF